MSALKLKRFYAEVSVITIEGGSQIFLDGKPLSSPEKNALLLPNVHLSEAMAGEWRAQTKRVAPDTMPLTQLAFTASDRVAPNRAAVIEQITAFANSDVVCYRASKPSDLVMRQKESWDPILEWADVVLGASLLTGEGIGYVEQDYDALCALTAAFSEKSDFYLAALYSLASIGNSLLFALAVAEKEIDAEEAFRCTNCDEIYQSEKWSIAPEARTRLKTRAKEYKVAAQFLMLLNEACPPERTTAAGAPS